MTLPSLRLPLLTVLTALLSLAGLLALPSEAHAGAAELKAHLLVVYNNLSPDSLSLAHYYAKARGIPDDRVFGIDCPQDEEITRAQFEKQIRTPIDQYLLGKGWIKRSPGQFPLSKDKTLDVTVATENKIWCIVLMKGIPLKIAHDPSLQEPPTTVVELNTNAASVDSELATLPIVGLPAIGVMPNPFYLLGFKRSFDELDALQMILVGRLDGPTANDVRRMIDDAKVAEQNRLAGKVEIDTRGLDRASSGYFSGDQMLLDSVPLFRKEGMEVDVDTKPDLFPDNLPWTNVALYAGWYAENAKGPFMREVKDGSTSEPAFAKGAIAYHIHSYDASTLRTDKGHWAGPLLAKGAAATMGAVYEPYLDFMPHWDDFTRRILDGETFIEAGYGSQKVLSWMITFVGDPLYTPFGIPTEKAIAVSGPGKHRDLLLVQTLRRQLNAAGSATDDADNLNDLKERLKTMAQDPTLTTAGWEGYGDLMSDLRLMPQNTTVAQAYEKAFNLATVLEDQERTNLKAAKAYQDRFRLKDAKRVLLLQLNRYPNESVYYGLMDYYKQVVNSDGIPSPASSGASPSTGNATPASLAAPALAPSSVSTPSLNSPAADAPLKDH